jgi:hypothetical protein
MNRRLFLQIAATASVAFVPSTLKALESGLSCRCRATILAPSYPNHSTTAFCPNCGRTLKGQQFELRTTGWIPSDKKAIVSAKPRQVWNPAQVPFPNPALVRASCKPTVSMSMVSA